MTRRVLVLGDSHLAALREGWRTREGRWPGLDLRFFGAHKALLLDTRIEAGQMVADSAAASAALLRLNGTDRTDLTGLDAIVIAGGQLSVLRAASLWRETRWTGLPSLLSEPDLADLSLPVLPAAAARATLTEALASRIALRLCRHLRQATDRPILILGQPRPNARVLSEPDARWRGLILARRAEDGPALSELFDSAADRAAARAGGRYLPQPARTRAQHLFTAPAFKAGAVRLAERRLPQPAAARSHANATYGTVLIDTIAETLGPG